MLQNTSIPRMQNSQTLAEDDHVEFKMPAYSKKRKLMKDKGLETRVFRTKSESAEVEYPVDVINRNLQVFYVYANVLFMSENQHWSI